MGCASAAAGSANSSMMAAEARIVFIESFLRSDVVCDLQGRSRGTRRQADLAPVSKPLSSRNKRAVAVRSNRLAATHNRPAAAAHNICARRSRHRCPGR